MAMQAVLVGVVLDAVIIMMILLLFSLLRRIDLLSFQLKDVQRRLDVLERKPPEGPSAGRERTVRP
jgi:hypothetical protein